MLSTLIFCVPATQFHIFFQALTVMRISIHPSDYKDNEIMTCLSMFSSRKIYGE